MYRKTQHSVYSITLHLVLVVKYRRDVINDTISKRIKEIFETIGLSHGVELIEWNHDSDHIHTIISISPSTDLNKYINASKAASSRLIKSPEKLHAKRIEATDERKKQSHQQALSHIGLVSLILCCGIVMFSINEETVTIPVAYIVGLLALFVLYLSYRIRR